jgi:hypothetical protein
LAKNLTSSPDEHPIINPALNPEENAIGTSVCDHGWFLEENKKSTTSSDRYAPFKTREPCIIVIEGNPFAAGLDDQCRKPCIGFQVATRVRFQT